MRLHLLSAMVVLASWSVSTVLAETSRFPPTMDHTPPCDQLAQQFNAKAAARVPPEFVRHLDNETLLIFGSRLPDTACHDADVYWKIRSETNAIQRKLVYECNGVWRDPETGKMMLSKSNIADVFGEEERRFTESRQKMCAKAGNKAN